MKVRILTIAVVLLALGFALAGPVAATTIHAQFMSVRPAVGVTIHMRGHIGATPYSEDAGTQVGTYRFYAETSDFPEIDPGSYYGTNCFEQQNVSYGGWYDYTVQTNLTAAPIPVSPYVNPDDSVAANCGHLSTNQVDLLKKLFARNANALWYAPDSTDIDPSGLIDPVGRVAIQLAVWEIAWEHTESPGNLTSPSGSFWVTDIGSSYISRAEAMLGNLGPWTSTTEQNNAPTLYAFTADGNQDQLWLIPGGGGPPVPEPLTMMGMFLGLGSLGAYIRKRRMA